MGGITIYKLLIVVAIIVLIFGTKKLRTLGSDLGASLKGFKKAMNEDPTENANSQDAEESSSKNVEDKSVK